MPQQRTDKPTEGKRPRFFSGRNLDLLLILSGFVLGASIEFLSPHIRTVGNYLLSVFIYWSQGMWWKIVEGTSNVITYLWHSWPGIYLEMYVIIVIIILLIVFYRRDDKKEDEVISILKEIRDAVKPSSGDGNATTESRTSKGGKRKGQK